MATKEPGWKGSGFLFGATAIQLERWILLNPLMIVQGLVPQLARMGWHATTDTMGRYFFVREEEGRYCVIEGPCILGLEVWRN